MKLIIFLILKLLFFTDIVYSKENDLSRSYIDLNELNELGSFENIKKFPEEIFKINMSHKGYAQKALQEVFKVFVQNKNLMEKYPENMMLGMAYFEVYYNQQLRENKRSIERFKNNYPDINYPLRKKIKTLYSLGQAKETMRSSLGLNSTDNILDAIDRYLLMHSFLKQGIKIEHKLSSEEKKLKKNNSKLKKYLGNLSKSFEQKIEKRISQKEFKKNIKIEIKNIKKTINILKETESEGKIVYTNIDKLFVKIEPKINICKSECKKEDLELITDSIKFSTTILQDTENFFIKKKYTQDMSEINLDQLSDEDKKTLTNVTKSLESQKIEKRNNFKKTLINLKNNNFPIEEYLNQIENDGINVISVSMNYDKIENMKRWAMKDWANSWRGSIAKEIKNKDGEIIKITEENINDIKAQLALASFEEFINISSLIEVNNELQELTNEIKSSFDLNSFLNQDFSITLDNYSSLLGFKNFNALNEHLNNEVRRCCRFGMADANTYAKAWESAQYHDSTSNWGDVTRGVDLINQVGSFEAGSIAASLGTDLQTVADSIAQAAVVGVSTDLEAISKGLGYSSFADAVAAYNKQYGTNYSVEEAKESLGQ